MFQTPPRPSPGWSWLSAVGLPPKDWVLHLCVFCPHVMLFPSMGFACQDDPEKNMHRAVFIQLFPPGWRPTSLQLPSCLWLKVYKSFHHSAFSFSLSLTPCCVCVSPSLSSYLLPSSCKIWFVLFSGSDIVLLPGKLLLFQELLPFHSQSF